MTEVVNRSKSDSSNTSSTPDPSVTSIDLGLRSPSLSPANVDAETKKLSSPQESIPSGFAPFRKLSDMWHPHVYASPPKCPTPFSIDDILKRKTRSNNNNMVFADLTTLHASALAAAAAAAAAATAAAVNRSGLNLSCGGGGSESSTAGSPRLPSPHTEDESVGAGSMDQPLNLTTKKADGERCDGNRAKDILKTLKGQKRKRDELPAPENGSLLGISGSGGDSGEDGESKKKKVRTTFTGRQIFELEKMFENKKYLSSSERADMAKLLNVTEQQVKIWFQNRRTKWKKQENISNAEAAELMKAKGGKDPNKTIPPAKVSTTSNAPSSPSSLSPSTEPPLRPLAPNLTHNGLSALLGKLSPASTTLLPPPVSLASLTPPAPAPAPSQGAVPKLEEDPRKQFSPCQEQKVLGGDTMRPHLNSEPISPPPSEKVVDDSKSELEVEEEEEEEGEGDNQLVIADSDLKIKTASNECLVKEV